MLYVSLSVFDLLVVILFYLSLCLSCLLFFFFKQMTAYEMRISDWSSDVCSSDLVASLLGVLKPIATIAGALGGKSPFTRPLPSQRGEADEVRRSEEHTSELQSLMRISYAVFCLKKKKQKSKDKKQKQIHQVIIKYTHIKKGNTYMNIITID